MDKIGITTAVIANPNKTIHQVEPDFTPNDDGKIKFPAPKNNENNAKPLIQISFLFNEFICYNFVKSNNLWRFTLVFIYICSDFFKK
jgi:hypothetical protein